MIVKRKSTQLFSISLLFGLTLFIEPGRCDPHSNQSVEVAIIGGAVLDTNNPCRYTSGAANVMGWTYGGCLPVSGTGELGDFHFSAMLPSYVNAANLTAFDTAVLNVASTAMACNTSTLTSSQKIDLIEFVESGKKLIIYDSECYPGPVDYSWIPFPFSTANPGAMGARGTLTVVEDNLLSTLIGDPSCSGGDIHCINVSHLGASTDAVGDMNVMTTLDPNWCVDISGTNALGITGPVHTYAKVGFDQGLMIYNGLDQDYQSLNDSELRQMWVQELQQPFNPSNLPCGVTVVGITLEPPFAQNMVGEEHEITAILKDLLGTPVPNVAVDFEVIYGPNQFARGSCSPNADCSTDANGIVHFAYFGDGGVGVDEIEACFINELGDAICSQTVFAEWVNTPPVAQCRDVTASANSLCQADAEDADINDNSYDPDGDPITLDYDPAGPYSLGVHEVTLTVADDKGATDTCTGTVTVMDDNPPVGYCNSPATIVPPDAPISFTATGTDNCHDSAVTITSYDCYMYNGAGKRVDKKNSCEVFFDGDTITIFDSGGVNDHITWAGTVVDGSGNNVEFSCEVLVVNPGHH